MANISPELLARLRGYDYTNTGSFYDPAGQRWYTPMWEDAGGSGNGADYTPNYRLGGWRGYDSSPDEFGADPARLNGRAYQSYDSGGQQTGGGTWSGIAGRSPLDAILPLAMVAAPFAAAMFPALGSAMSFGANPVLSGASMTGASQALGAGGAMAGAAGGTAAGHVAGDAFMPGILGPGGSEVAFGSAAAGAGATGAAKLLGPAAALLGAAAGAKGQKTSESSVKSMDPRMDALVYGDLAPRVQGLLAQQMSPQGQQGWLDMQGIGRGLLSGPVAGNGFNRFFGGR